MSGDWKDLFASRLTTAQGAVQRVKPGDTVNVPIIPPRSLLDALWGRRDELRDVRLQMTAPYHNPGWLDAGSEEAFSVDFELFIGDFARSAHDEKRGYYLPNLFSTGFKHVDERRPGARTPSVGIVSCSPPNDAGYVHFGPHHWTKRSLVRRAEVVIAEVDPSLIQVHGDVYAHVSEFDCFVEAEAGEVDAAGIEEMLERVPEERREAIRGILPQIPKANLRAILPLLPTLDPSTLQQLLERPEPPASSKAIAGHLSELVEDGDCIQIGMGEPSAAMVRLGALDGRCDLGMHTELLVPGAVTLVDAGVINGKRKNQFQGKVVGAAWSGATDEEMEIIRDNPTFQLFDPEYILHIPRIAANERQVSINSAISVDLLGQINSESVFGGRMINGTGGQPETHLGAFLSKGGRAVTLLPSTAVDGTVSRIVPELEAGSIVTIPRFFADLVITEYGIARLLGKNHRERAEELVGVAHPDFRPDLHKAVQRMFEA